MNNIKIYRIQSGLTLAKLADMLNISAGYLCHLENGTRNNPSYKTMLKISVALNKSISDVFDAK